VAIGSVEVDDDDDLEALGMSLGPGGAEEEEEEGGLGSEYFEDRLRHLSSLIIENPKKHGAEAIPNKASF
jgi:hypothetical protein